MGDADLGPQAGFGPSPRGKARHSRRKNCVLRVGLKEEASKSSPPRRQTERSDEAQKPPALSFNTLRASELRAREVFPCALCCTARRVVLDVSEFVCVCVRNK